MIIKTVRGNLVSMWLQAKKDDSDSFDIAHGCNNMCGFGAGIAKDIAIHIPEAEQADKNTAPGATCKLGSYSMAFEPGSKHNVINMYCLYDHSLALSYDLLAQCFAKYNAEFPGRTLYIPAIGAGIAGGDWDKIQRVINATTPDVDIVYVEWDKSEVSVR